MTDSITEGHLLKNDPKYQLVFSVSTVDLIKILAIWRVGNTRQKLQCMYGSPTANNWKLKQRRRRRRGQRLAKNEYEIRDCLDLFGMPMALKTCYSYICNDGVQFQIEIRKISFRRPRFVDNAELGHFTLLFWRGRQKNVQRFITHVYSHCSVH